MHTFTATLVPFAPSPGGIKSIQASIAGDDQKILRIAYRLDGAMDMLKMPAGCPARRADRLWEHTCFEAFIRAAGDKTYYEFNFSPSGEWAAYSFRAYRDGMASLGEDSAPEILVRRDVDKLELEATARLDRLPALAAAATWQIGLSAVIEAGDGGLSYWALKHPAAKPDFHHADSFIVDLTFPSQGG